jgi:hypothetical protein
MSLHLTKQGANKAASALELDASRRGSLRASSSGNRFRRFSVRRKFLFWEAYESTR